MGKSQNRIRNAAKCFHLKISHWIKKKKYNAIIIRQCVARTRKRK
ncbi:unnamed protein product [Spirodela intermedia]|uniref:Uncharacterized protein n=2 Tax=Spirodela intermedia TaxID=51605 RepID=A0A7I8KRQ6_SPIIN|nr:unnamed protein product [Spirodela intermedia]CAA6663654.1 unnamed protein product [Spirodela intermedia]CAA7400142.1 unnamed protein product [Spirodela intermedia]